MKSRRFDYDRDCSPGALSPCFSESAPTERGDYNSARKYPKWIRVSDIGGSFLRDSTGSARKKIFAVVSPPIPADFGRKTIRHILIFDNHPESLRLISGRRLDTDVDLGAPKITSWRHIVLGLVPILAVVFATLWLLL
jgi:hypothetical protein